MNDEIKEMLEQMESIAITGKNKNGIKVDGYGLQQNELKILLDYITNLQQENEIRQQDINNLTYQLAKIKEENERLKGITYNPEKTNNKWVEEESELRKVYRERDDYKSRCEKASEILHNLNDTLPLDLILSEIEHSENILQNGSEN